MNGHKLFEDIEVADPGYLMKVVAEDVCQERTGTHARIMIFCDEVLLAHSYFNVSRDEERVRIVNAALKRVPGPYRQGLADGRLKFTLDRFTLDLWERHCRVSEIQAELMAGDATIGPPALIAGPYCIDGGGTLIFGPPGKGKSTIAMALAVSLDAGCSRVWPVHEKKTLYVNIERSRLSMQYRLARTNMALRLDAQRPLPFLNARGRSLMDVRPAIQRAVAQYEIEVIVVDSISRAGAGEMNKDTVANGIVDTLNGLAPTWIALAHTPRQDDTHIYGSVHFEAGEDVGVRLTSETNMVRNVSGVALEVTKANDMRKPPVACYALEWENEGLADIREARHGEFPALESDSLTLVDEIRELLLMTGAMSGSDVASELGRPRSKVAETLSRDDQFVFVRKDGKKVLYGVKTNG